MLLTSKGHGNGAFTAHFITGASKAVFEHATVFPQEALTDWTAVWWPACIICSLSSWSPWSLSTTVTTALPGGFIQLLDLLQQGLAIHGLWHRLLQGGLHHHVHCQWRQFHICRKRAAHIPILAGQGICADPWEIKDLHVGTLLSPFWSPNHLITKLFVEQPRLHRVC